MIADREFAERYLLEKLTPEQQDQYERHYFDCERCFEELQQLLAIQKELESEPLQAPAPRPASRPPRPGWLWPALAGAAAMLVVVVVLAPRHEAVAPAPSAVTGARPILSITELARVDPPLYEARVLRGLHDAASAAFREGMKAYTAGEYDTATTHLQEAAAADSARPDIAFYLGASELLANQPDAARAEFERLLAMGETAFTGEAHFYLGKALLRLGRLQESRQAFLRAAESAGLQQAEARAVLESLAGMGVTQEPR